MGDDQGGFSWHNRSLQHDSGVAMPDSKEQMARAIEMALAHELEAEKFYTKASQLELAEEAKSTLAFLAKEELKHHQELRDRFIEVIQEMDLEKKVDAEDYIRDLIAQAEEKLERLNLHELNTREILEIALKEERKAKDLYLLNASVYTQPEVKKTFMTLAKDEEEHIKTLKALIHLLDKDIISPERLV
jgi:rubrerythrin